MPTSASTSPRPDAMPGPRAGSMAQALLAYQLVCSNPSFPSLSQPVFQVERTAVTALYRRDHGLAATRLDPVQESVIPTEYSVMISVAGRQRIADGMRNAITDNLPALARADFSSIAPAIASASSASTTPRLVAEVLKELGGIQLGDTRDSQLWVLEYALNSPSPIIRDGAGLGLARLSDRRALPQIKAAIAKEQDPLTKDGLELVAAELESA